MHVILLDPNKIMLFIVDVTKTCDKEYLMDMTKVTITDKTILTESELETVQNSICVSMVHNNCVYSIPCMYSMQTLNII